ncbi:MAG: hypothetical protein Kow0063_09000 [Anaerolineae bacterium]
MERVKLAFRQRATGRAHGACHASTGSDNSRHNSGLPGSIEYPPIAIWGILVVLTLVAFLLRASHLDGQSLWRDEVDVIRLASEPVSQLLKNLTLAGHNGPLYYFLMRGWLNLAGYSEFALRYLSLCFGVLAVSLVYVVGKRLAGQKTAVLAAGLAAISPYLVWYSQDAKMYALVTALTLLAMTCLLEALVTSGGRWWVGFVVFASLSLYIHMLSALMIPVYGAAFLWASPRNSRQWRWGLVAFGLLTLPYLPLAIWQLPLVLKAHNTGHPFYPLDQMLALLFNLYARGVAMVGSWVTLAGYVFAILAGCLLTTGRPARSDLSRDRSSTSLRRVPFLLLIWLVLPIALVYIVSLRTPIFEPRYLIYLAPAFYLLTASGIVALSRLSWMATGLALTITLAFSLLGVWVQAGTPIKSDFRAAAAYVAAHRQNNAPIMFQMPYVRHTFDYYYHGEYIALEGLWTNDGVSQAQVDERMARLLDGYSEIWLLTSESWLWDSRDLTRAWLDEHADLIQSASFTLVDVYHYRFERG